VNSRHTVLTEFLQVYNHLQSSQRLKIASLTFKDRKRESAKLKLKVRGQLDSLNLIVYSVSPMNV